MKHAAKIRLEVETVEYDHEECLKISEFRQYTYASRDIYVNREEARLLACWLEEFIALEETPAVNEQLSEENQEVLERIHKAATAHINGN